MTDEVSPRWEAADAAVESLVATLLAEVAQSARRRVRGRPRRRPRSKRRPKGIRREIAEVIRSRRLAPGLRVDRNMVAALLIGHRDLVSNPVLVVAVARACGIIAGRKLSAKKVARMRAASIRVAKLIARAEADTQRAPAPRVERAPAPRVETAPAPRVERAPAPRARWWLAAAVVLLVVVAVLAILAASGCQGSNLPPRLNSQGARCRSTGDVGSAPLGWSLCPSTTR